MAKYDDLFPPSAVTHQFGFTRFSEPGACAICNTTTQWYNSDFKSYLCSQECELKFFETQMESQLNLAPNLDPSIA